MSFLFSWLNKKKYPDIEGEWFGAGIHFVNCTHILAGYTYKYGSPRITGIGGRSEDNEKYYETAIRETLEELFGVVPTNELVTRVSRAIRPQHVLNNNGYIIMICTMNDLDKIIRILKTSADAVVAYYDSIPANITELIFNRINIHNAEIQSIVLFPVESVLEGTLERSVDESLIDDIKLLIARGIITVRI